MNRSADAAEHLAKALLVRNGHLPRSIHDLDRLADDIATGYPNLAEMVRSLNGHTKGDHTRHYNDSLPATAEAVAYALQRLLRTGQMLAAELPHWRDAQLNYLQEDIEAFAIDLKGAQAVPLDETASEEARAALAMRNGRVVALRGADALLTAWKEPLSEPLAVEDDDPKPSPF